jgi:hypothetical protein
VTETTVPSEPARKNSRHSRRTAWLALFCVLAGFMAYVGLKSRELPERVATHFNLEGRADGWMTRAKHRQFSLAAGVGSPLFVVGVFALIRLMGGAGLNVPNKQFWLAPERRDETFGYIERRGIWLAVLTAGFHGGLFYTVIDANSRRPPFMPMWEIGTVAGLFLATVAVWIILFLVHFRRTAP